MPQRSQAGFGEITSSRFRGRPRCQFTDTNGQSDAYQAQTSALLSLETKLELEKKGNGTIKEEDLILPNKKLASLATLYSSLVSCIPSFSKSYTHSARLQIWFAGQIASLRSSTGAAHAASGDGARSTLRDSVYSTASTDTARSTVSGHGDDAEDAARPEGFALPLTNDMIKYALLHPQPSTRHC